MKKVTNKDVADRYGLQTADVCALGEEIIVTRDNPDETYLMTARVNHSVPVESEGEEEIKFAVLVGVLKKVFRQDLDVADLNDLNVVITLEVPKRLLDKTVVKTVEASEHRGGIYFTFDNKPLRDELHRYIGRVNVHNDEEEE